MTTGWRERLLEFMRVPAEPVPPPGDPRLLRTFRAAPSFYGYSIAKWALKQASAAVGLFFSYMFVMSIGRNLPIPYFGLIEALFVAAFLLQLPFSFMLVRLDFEMRWYMLTDRSIRIRHGIVFVHEQTMTFANVQNITIRQNPLQRLFGISTVAVRAAGGGGGSDSSSGSSKSHVHEAVFEGVDDAGGIRDVIRDRIRHYRDAGLGDLEDPAPAVPAGAAAAQAALPLASAQRLLEEVRSLRGVLAR